MAGGQAARAAGCGGRKVDDFAISSENRVLQAPVRVLSAQARVISTSGRAVRTVERARSACAAVEQLRQPLAVVAKSPYAEFRVSASFAPGGWGEAGEAI